MSENVRLRYIPLISGSVCYIRLADQLLHSMIGNWHHPIVRLCVCSSVCDALHCGSRGRCTGLNVVPAYILSRQVPIPFRHFCCTMYRLATKRVEVNANVSFLRHRKPRVHWFIANYFLVIVLQHVVRSAITATAELLVCVCRSIESHSKARETIPVGPYHSLILTETSCHLSSPKIFNM